MIYRAQTIMPIDSEPIDDGAIFVEGERIADVGTFESIQKAHRDAPVMDFGRALIMPGLVNLHSHIELEVFSDLARPTSFLPWVKQIVKRGKKMRPEEWLVSGRLGARRMLDAGITAVGDISRWGIGGAAMAEIGLRGISYQEMVIVDDESYPRELASLLTRIESVPTSAARRVGISPHAPYSLSKGTIERLVALSEEKNIPLSIHVAETNGEVEMIERGAGDFVALYGSLIDTGLPPSGTELSPIKYLDTLGALSKSTLAVHCVHVDKGDVEILKARKTSLALCPTSNMLLEGQTPPVDLFLDAKVPFGLGTDSAASNPNLDLFDEMRAVQRLAFAKSNGRHTIDSKRLLELATIEGAKMLGLSEHIGSLVPGKLADMVVLSCTSNDALNDPLTWANRNHISHVILGGRIASSPSA